MLRTVVECSIALVLHLMPFIMLNSTSLWLGTCGGYLDIQHSLTRNYFPPVTSHQHPLLGSFSCPPKMTGVLAVIATDRGYGQSGGGGHHGASIVQDQRRQNAYGEYSFQYETSDGTSRQEAGKQNNGQMMQGGYR